MPKIAIYKQFIFFVYMHDLLNEPPHLHVVKNKSFANDAKIWIETMLWAETGDLSAQEQNLIEKLVRQNRFQLLNAWNRGKKGEKIETLKLTLL